jgi:hypothetical protein
MRPLPWTGEPLPEDPEHRHSHVAPHGQHIAHPERRDYAGGDKGGVFAIMGHEAEITKDCKNPEIAAKWLDAFYTNEASIQNFWGAIGTVITKNDDGTYVPTIRPKAPALMPGTGIRACATSDRSSWSPASLTRSSSPRRAATASSWS